MPNSKYVSSDYIRQALVNILSERFAHEVPAYKNFKSLTEEKNSSYITKHPEEAPSLSRIINEKHGAIRVGTPKELLIVQMIFEICGMFSVDTYDMTNIDGSNPVPIIGTAFVPLTEEELNACAFRMFCSLLDVDNRNFFTEKQSDKMRSVLSERNIASDKLLNMFETFKQQAGFTTNQADEFAKEAAKTFEMSANQVVDIDLYFELREVSQVAADIVCFQKPHLNHLTPRVYDIKEMHKTLNEKGIPTIARIQGPPILEDFVGILLNQTSIKAPGEEVYMTTDAKLRKELNQDPSLIGKLEDNNKILKLPKNADESDKDYYLRLKAATKEGGFSLAAIVHKARFGELEARNVALTEKGEAFYRKIWDDSIAEVNKNENLKTEKEKMDGFHNEVLPRIYAERMPKTHMGLYEKDLAFYKVKITEIGLAANKHLLRKMTTKQLVTDGYAEIDPITYENFLGESAAGIFRANVDDDTRTSENKHEYDQKAKHAEALGKPPLDHIAIYKAIAETSEKKLLQDFGIEGQKAKS